MSTFEWAMVSIAAAGFLVTVGGVIGSCVWAVGKIRQATEAQIKDERIQRADAITKAMARFDEAQATQDHNFGEVGLSLRRFIEEVEKEMHKIEMWGRDNYALKDDVKDLRTDIKDMRTEIKADIGKLSEKIDKQQQ
jgi:septal ring factor EnvC (AmiA/AmiB activator)